MSDRSDSIGSFSTESRRIFYEDHRSLAPFMILVVFAAPFVGLYVAGLWGVVVGVFVGLGCRLCTHARSLEVARRLTHRVSRLPSEIIAE
ncbi:MAG: hypothetical protein NTAFB01_43840 [Nitrospira sp.]